MIKKMMAALCIYLWLIFGCSSTSPDAEFQITITILQNGVIQESYTFTEDDKDESIPVLWQEEQIGTVEISTFEVYDGSDDDLMATRFLISARKESSYSLITTLSGSETWTIDYQTDFLVHPANVNCGVMYDPTWGAISDITFEVFQDTVLVDTITTGEYGDFVTELEPAEYKIYANGYYNEIQLEEGYNNYSIWFSDCVEKPNIYLYPETEISLDVNITFPENGRVSTSIPEFPAQWQEMKVTPDGKIDEQYDYLFYETEQLALFSPDKGWVIARKELENFFRYNMKQTGFIDREVEDFISYWIPRFTDSEFFAVYPLYNEQIDPLIKLEFSQQPDSILRLLYIVKECDTKDIKLTAPVIPVFSSKGFVVREWGVIRQ